MRFTKMHGLGNDFVIVDVRDGTKLPACDKIAVLSNRKTGIGCDQFIAIEPTENCDVFMRIYNPDGSEAEACGNATRCVASMIMKETGKHEIVVETVAGMLECWLEKDGRVTTDMGVPKDGWKDIPVAKESDTLKLPITFNGSNAVGVNVGNPHAVFFLDEVENINLKAEGPKLETDTLFPEKANIEFVQVKSKSELRMRVWERGAGETMACGSGACAAVIAGVRRGLTGRKVKVVLDGGVLDIVWRESDSHILMTGAVAYVFSGDISVNN
jgi:diaminopimelate epimerase